MSVEKTFEGNNNITTATYTSTVTNQYCRGCFKQIKVNGNNEINYFCDGYCYNKYATRLLKSSKFDF